jgi:hypothetical protein
MRSLENIPYAVACIPNSNSHISPGARPATCRMNPWDRHANTWSDWEYGREYWRPEILEKRGHCHRTNLSGLPKTGGG